MVGNGRPVIEPGCLYHHNTTILGAARYRDNAHFNTKHYQCDQASPSEAKGVVASVDEEDAVTEQIGGRPLAA